MGGHGGLNILPQKRWNVYNFDNREKVKRDEEAAAREEQLRLEQSRRAEAEFRLNNLRRARGIATATAAVTASATTVSTLEPVSATLDSVVEGSERDSGHINLFEGSSDFGSLASVEHRESKKAKLRDEEAGSHKKDHKRRREEKKKAKEAKVIDPEEEKYRLGYKLAGKGVNKPWYLTKPVSYDAVDGDKEMGKTAGRTKKKSKEELRQERIARERAEKERERKLLTTAGKRGFR